MKQFAVFRFRVFVMAFIYFCHKLECSKQRHNFQLKRTMQHAAGNLRGKDFIYLIRSLLPFNGLCWGHFGYLNFEFV